MVPYPIRISVAALALFCFSHLLKMVKIAVWPHFWPQLSESLFLFQIQYPGVAQMVGRHIWDVEAASSSLATRTKNGWFPLKSTVFVIYSIFLRLAQNFWNGMLARVFILYSNIYLFKSKKIIEYASPNLCLYRSIFFIPHHAVIPFICFFSTSTHRAISNKLCRYQSLLRLRS